MRTLCAIGLILAWAASTLAQELKIGLIPEQNVFKQMQRYEPLGTYVEEKTGLQIRFTILSRYGNIIDSFVGEKMDGAFWGSFTGALAIQKAGVEPIARPVWKDGTSTYHGYIFVREDSGIRGTADMKGKSVAFVDRATTAGYIFPSAYFREQGIEDIDAYFGETFFAGSHDAAIDAVLNGKADVGCAKNTIYQLMQSDHPNMAEDLRILARSPDVPSNGLGLRNGLPPGTKKALKRALVEMQNDPKGREVLDRFGALRFEETTTDDYAPVFQFAAQAGIDLATYQYLNE